jgi:mannose-6-phosphate isomerase-like protein (cupin superfamily)
MITMPAGITSTDQAFDGVVWHLLGQTYTLKQHSEDSMAWHAVFPDGTFVPPHLHHGQDEFLYVLSGRYDVWLDGKDLIAKPGDLERSPARLRQQIRGDRDKYVLGRADAGPEDALRPDQQLEGSAGNGPHREHDRGQFRCAAGLGRRKPAPTTPQMPVTKRAMITMMTICIAPCEAMTQR